MRIRIGVPDEHVNPDVIDAALEAVTRTNQHMLAAGQTPTSHELIAAGCKWRPENLGDEHFDHGGTIASRGWGDCDDWAPLHAATLRATGEDPGAIARVIPSGPNTYHALVQRSDGTVDDPSIAAGMTPLQGSGPAVIGSAGELVQTTMYAYDPHDGRFYQGALAPTVGPLTAHCGPGVAIRGCHVIGHGRLYEARVDIPIDGSKLTRVRSYLRRTPGHHHHRVIGGFIPYTLSATHLAGSPEHALHGAVLGALIVGDASGSATNLDKYKLLALQSAMAGMSPGQVHASLMQRMHADLLAEAAQSGRSHHEHARSLRAKAGLPTPHVSGFFDDIADVATSVVSDVSKVASSVVTAVPWGDIIHGAQAAVSVIPGLGTAVSDVLATAETVYESAAAIASGNPLAAALHAAYNYATASIPGAASIRFILDPVVNTLIDLTGKHEPVESMVIDQLLQKVPDAPKVGPVSPRSIAASLAHIIADKLGVKKSPNYTPKSQPAAAPPKPAAPPKKVLPLKLAPPPKKVLPMKLAPGAAHAATPANPTSPPHPTAASAPAMFNAPPPPPTIPAAGSSAVTRVMQCTPMPDGQWACAWQ
jgi:hypothetical protein